MNTAHFTIESSPLRRAFISFWTLFKRELLRIYRLSVQTILAPLISNLLFLGIFGGMFAGRTVMVEGVSYLAFITPGLAFSAVALSGFQNPLFSVLMLKYQDTIGDFALFPLTDFGRMAAFVLAGSVRGMLVGMATYVAAGCFAGFDIHRPVAFWTLLFAIGLLVAMAGYVTGLFFDSMEKTNFITSLFLTPLIYLSGVFFDVNTLPGMWRTIAAHNPLAILVDIARRLYIDNYPGQITPLQNGILLVFVTLVAGLTWQATVRGTGIVKR